MKKTLIVVDMQKDFIDGALGTKEAVDIVQNVKNKIAEYKSRGDEIIFTTLISKTTLRRMRVDISQ